MSKISTRNANVSNGNLYHTLITYHTNSSTLISTFCLLWNPNNLFLVFRNHHLFRGIPQGYVVGSPAHPFILMRISLLLPQTQGAQPLSCLERVWINEPVFRPVHIIGRLPARQVQVWTQPREAILVTCVGRTPPSHSRCTKYGFGGELRSGTLWARWVVANLYVYA